MTALPVAALLFNALVWGVSWWPLRALHTQGLHPLWATVAIYLLSLAALLLWQPRAAHLARGHAGLWLLAAASGLTNVGFNWAVTVGDVVRVVLLFYLMPAWSVLLAWPLLGERPDGAKLLRLALALAGVGVVLGAGSGGWPLPRSVPDALALLGGFSFALTNVMLRRLQAVPAPARVLAMFGGGALFAALAGLAGGLAGAVPAPPLLGTAGWAIALALGLAFLLSNVALQYGAARLAAHTTALVMLSEVVFASASSVVAGTASLGPRVLLGGAMILAAAAWSAWPQRRPDSRAEGR